MISSRNTNFSTLRGCDRSRLVSRSKLLCFFSCIFRARSARESVLRITKSSGASLDDGGKGGRRSVMDSSTWLMSSMVVCRRFGNAILTTTSGRALSFFSSRSGVEVHDDGRFGNTELLLLLLPLLSLPLLFNDDRFDVDVQFRPGDLSRLLSLKLE